MAACRATAAARSRTRATAPRSGGGPRRPIADRDPKRRGPVNRQFIMQNIWYVRTNSCVSARRMCRSLRVALLFLVASSAGAQQASESPRPPGLSFLEALGAPSSSDVAAVDGGEVVVWPV